MRFNFKWIRVGINMCLAFVFLVSALHHKTVIYLARQANGQLALLWNRQSFDEYVAQNQLSDIEIQNLLLVDKIKKYSVDSLGYKPTNNFTTIFNQGNAPSLWVITACEPYELKAYEWTFPMVGTVSYKGFFRKDLAEKEVKKLLYLGYDVDLRGVSAWSTLGWFDDPVLSNTLKRSKGNFCNLLFHELFHATYYAKSSVDLNENLASFVAHKATLQFLAADTVEKREYETSLADHTVFNNFMLRQSRELKTFYPLIKDSSSKYILKMKKLEQICDSINYLPLRNKDKFIARKKSIFTSKNACFIDIEQYESKQDSIESVFNKIYKGNIKKLVRDLTSNKINY